MVGPNEQLNNIISEFVFRLIEEGLESSAVEKSIVAFTFLIHRLGKLDNLSESDRILLASFLKKNLRDLDNPTRLLESYFQLWWRQTEARLEAFLSQILHRSFSVAQNKLFQMAQPYKRRWEGSNLG